MRIRCASVAAGLAAALALTGCAEGTGGAATGAATPEDAVRTTGHAVVLLDADGDGEPVQIGGAQVDVTTLALDGGEVTVEAGRDGAALRFPTFVRGRGTYPRAALAVSNATTYDALSPGSRDFKWSAEISLDRRSSDSRSGSVDNGDNVLQRGLAGSGAQFKLELDGRRPACVVEGSLGTVKARYPHQIPPGRWHRVVCSRFTDSVAVTVVPLERKNATGARRNVTGPIGTVSFEDPELPLTVGGKAGRDGRLVSRATDQFNGWIRKPQLLIAGRP